MMVPEHLTLTDSEKLDRLLAGFDNLQSQYNEIKMDHELLRDECKLLRDENKRLKQALVTMNNGAGRDYLKCEDLLQEIVELKESMISSREELEEYKRLLEESNAGLAAAVDALRQERAKRCNCFWCRFSYWFVKK